MNQRRYALIGAGHRAQMYVDAIIGPYADHAALVAICEPNPVRAAVLRRPRRRSRPPAPARLLPGPTSRRWSPPRGRPSDRDRAATTCTPSSSSGRLDAGADVVVEKPLTIDEDGAAAIDDAIDRTGREVVVTFNYRYSPRNTALRQVIQDGTIGEVTSVDF